MVTTNPRAYYHWGNREKLVVDDLFLDDGRRVWCGFDFERPESKTFPEIREEPFSICGHVDIEDDTTYTAHLLTLDGFVVRKVHESTRGNDILGAVIEAPRLMEDSEVEALFQLVLPLS
jgi:hypothetical protein